LTLQKHYGHFIRKKS